MNVPFYVTVVCAAVVAVAQRVASAILSALSRLLGAIKGIVRAGCNLARAAWRHPVLSITSIGTTVLTWLFLGWVPFLSVITLAVVLGMAGWLVLRLYRRWKSSRQSHPTPPNAPRNGRPSYRSHNSVPAGVS